MRLPTDSFLPGACQVQRPGRPSGREDGRLTSWAREQSPGHPMIPWRPFQRRLRMLQDQDLLGNINAADRIAPCAPGKTAVERNCI